MTDYAVELKNVTKQFPGPGGEAVVAVKNVSLEIRDGEFFSLLGPSGCGKTTSLRLIAGFEMPTDGQVLIHGRAMGATPPFQRPVNTVFQHYALFPHMTVGENVAFGLQMKGIPKSETAQRVSEALAMVRLPNMEKRKPKQLSGGQQQRVALARALVNRPEVLLLDEPLGALDLKLRKEMQLELKTLQREVGITFIYVTHDQEEALTMSDRIAVMSAGVALQVGPPAEVYERPRSRFVADFIGETNFITAQVKSLSASTATVEADGLAILAERPSSDIVAGQVVTVAIRPEKIRLVPASGGNGPGQGSNTLSGEVEDMAYIGTHTYYSVRLSDGVGVRVRQQNATVADDPEARGRVGASVRLTFPPEAARLLVV